MRHIPLTLCLILAPAAAPLAAQDLALDSLLRIPVSSVAKYAQTVSQAAASVTVITAEDIRRHGYRTLDEILRRVPGYYTTYDRNYAYVGVRGFGRPGDYSNRVLVLIDGHTTNEAVFGSAAVGTDLALDPDLIERVEVVHGPGSALYGTGAMLTSINVVTRSGRDLRGARISVGAGSAGSRGASIVAGGEPGRGVDVVGGASWNVTDGRDVYYPEYDDSANNLGVAHHLDWDRYGSAYLRVKAGNLGVSAFASTRSKGFPTGAFGTVFNDPAARTSDRRAFVEARYALTGAVTQLDLRAFFSHYGYDGAYPFGPTNFDIAVDDALGTEARLRWDIGSRNRVLVGAEFQRHARVDYRSWDTDTVYLDVRAPYGVLSLYAQNELQLFTRLAVIVGLRHDKQDGVRATTSPRLALVFHPTTRTTLKLLYGEAFRAPSTYELNGYPGGAGIGTAVLRAERIRTYEAVWEQRLTPSLFATVSLHQFRMRDLIDTQVDPVDSLLQFTNVALASSAGATVALNARLASGASAYLSYGLERATDGSTGASLTNSPQHIAQGGLAAPIGLHAVLGGEVRFESPRGTLNGGYTDSYVRTGLHLILTPGRLESAAGSLLKRTELALGVQNLFGTPYASPGFFEHAQESIQQDGRTVSARLRLRI